MIKSITRFITLAALFLIPIFPLIVANSYFFPFITGKAFYFRILVEIAFASWIILAFMDARYRPRLNMLTLAVTLFTIIALCADLLGVNPLKSFWSNFERMEGWITIFHLWMFYIVSTSTFSSMSHGREEGKVWWHYFMNTFISVGIIVSIYAYVQLLGGAVIHQGSRIDASLGNAAYMAVYMLMNAGMAAYLFFVTLQTRPNSVALKVLYAVLALNFAFLLFETATRGTILGLTGGIMLALFLYAIFGDKESKKSRMISGGVILGIILIGAIFWMNRQSPFVQKYEVLQRLATISINDVTTQARGYIWPMAIKGFTQRPILGWGQENFNYIFNANYNPKMWTQEQWFDRAHSVFLDWLVASGIVGFLAYISLYVIAFMIIWKAKIPLVQKCVLTGFLTSYVIHNIFVFDNLASYVGFFAILGFIGSSFTPIKTNNSTEVILGGKREVNMEIVEYVVAPVSIIAVVLVLYFTNVRLIQANHQLIAALQSCSSPLTADPSLFSKVFSLKVYTANQEAREQLVTCANPVIQNGQVPGPNKQNFFAAAAQAIDDQIKVAPKDARMYVIGGQFFSSLGQPTQALDLLEKAHALSPGKQTIDFELANNYINTGNAEKALQVLKQAYEGDPTYAQAQSGYAYGLMILGREAEARKIFGDNPQIFASEQAAQIYASPQLKNYNKALEIYQNLLSKNPTDLNLKTRLAQVQYLSGRIDAAVITLRSISKDHPEYKEQIEATISSITGSSH